MLVHLEKLAEKAEKDGYAIGAFNTFNLETTLGIARAAVKLKAPVIIQVSETTIKYAGLKPITHIVETIAKNEAVEVPVVLHLDHGKKFSSVAECIEAGFTSIMIDASDLAFDENVKITKMAVDYAHKRDIWAQGELGRVIKDVDDMDKKKVREETMTDPIEADEFVKKTGVDTLAVAIGNVHGIDKIMSGVPELDYKRLEQIKAKVGGLPLVLHGASGINEKNIKKAIDLGVRIINIDTEIRLAFTEALRDVMLKYRTEIDPREIMEKSIEAVQVLVEKKISMFGSENKG